VAVALVLTSISPALGGSPTTLYVDGASPSCSDFGSGAQAAPFCTIGAAVAKVAPGQTVQVAGGTYSEKVTISKSGTPTAPIALRAAPGATVTVTGGTNGFVISGRSWITVDGFTVTNTPDYGITVSSSSSITISNNNVSYAGFQTSGMTRAGIRLNNSTDSLIVGNKSHDNSYAGIMVVGGTRNEVRGNETFRNARGFERAAPGIRIYESTANVVDNNITVPGTAGRVLHGCRLQERRRRRTRDRRRAHRPVPRGRDQPRGQFNRRHDHEQHQRRQRNQESADTQ